MDGIRKTVNCNLFTPPKRSLATHGGNKRFIWLVHSINIFLGEALDEEDDEEEESMCDEESDDENEDQENIVNKKNITNATAAGNQPADCKQQ